MSVISVYRTFYWTEAAGVDGGRLAGQTGYTWETKEEQARCIKEPDKMVTSGLQMVDPTYIPPTKDQQQRDCRYHISAQHCLCGIHGYFSPTYLSLVMVSNGRAAGVTEGEAVITRVRLGGLVDIHSMGARGEYGMIEEAWAPDDIAEAIGKQYDIPVNRSDYESQSRTDPILDGDAKIKRLTPLFMNMPEAMAALNTFGPGAPFGPITPASVGMKVVRTPSMTRKVPPLSQFAASMLGGGPTPPNPFGPNPFGPANNPGGLAPGGTVTGRSNMPGRHAFGPPPPWTSQFMRSMYNASPGQGPPAACSAPPGTNCQCGACTGALWQCPACGKYELSSVNHTARLCQAGLPNIMPAPGSIGVDKAYKPGIITRLKRAFGI